MQDRVPVNPGRVLITPENGSAAYYATMTRADNPTQEGTPLNKASLLKDATAAQFGLGTDSVPDDVFAAAKALIDSANANANTKAKIATGSYTGTGTHGASNPNSLTFDFEPKLVICSIRGRGLSPQSGYFNGGFLWLPNMPTVNIGTNTTVTFTQNGNTLSWYSANGHGDYQLNGSANTYDYFAIG